MSELQQEFVANVSHELRTPLTSIKSYVEALINGAMEDKGVKDNFLGVVEKETERMVRLVQDLLILSQLDHRQIAWKKEWTDLKGFIEEIKDQVQVDFEEEAISLKINVPPDLPSLYVDRDRIKQVLLNILNNARQYTSKGGKVTLEAREESGQLALVVTDTGCGIPPEDLPRIFERFYRVDKTRSRNHGGTGLGLSIARQIVEAHGGKMSIESKSGEGTRVMVNLPFSEVREIEGGETCVGKV